MDYYLFKNSTCTCAVRENEFIVTVSVSELYLPPVTLLESKYARFLAIKNASKWKIRMHDF